MSVIMKFTWNVKGDRRLVDYLYSRLALLVACSRFALWLTKA